MMWSRRGLDGVAVLAITCGALVGAALADESAAGSDELAARQQRVFRTALGVVAPAVVRIETIGGAMPVRHEEDPAGRAVAAPGFRQADGATTGVIWSSDGYIITSSINFIRDPSIITVTLNDGRKFIAKLLARDRPARLALLKIDAERLPTPQLQTPAATRPGQWALAAGVGHGGAGPALTVGVVSAVQRMNGLAVQTDAKISPANYGGPLFDIEGRVLGVCVPIATSGDDIAGVEWYDSGIGFAATTERIERHLPRLKRGEDVERGFLGIVLSPEEAPAGASSTQPVEPGELQPARTTDSVSEAVAGLPGGMRIAGDPRGPAVEAGLKSGDIITHLDGAPTPRLIELRRALWARAAGDTIEIRYRRGEAPHETRLKLAREKDIPPPATQPAAASQPASQPTTQP